MITVLAATLSAFFFFNVKLEADPQTTSTQPLSPPTKNILIAQQPNLILQPTDALVKDGPVGKISNRSQPNSQECLQACQTEVPAWLKEQAKRKTGKLGRIANLGMAPYTPHTVWEQQAINACAEYNPKQKAGQPANATAPPAPSTLPSAAATATLSQAIAAPDVTGATPVAPNKTVADVSASIVSRPEDPVHVLSWGKLGAKYTLTYNHRKYQVEPMKGAESYSVSEDDHKRYSYYKISDILSDLNMGPKRSPLEGRSGFHVDPVTAEITPFVFSDKNAIAPPLIPEGKPISTVKEPFQEEPVKTRAWSYYIDFQGKRYFLRPDKDSPKYQDSADDKPRYARYVSYERHGLTGTVTLVFEINRDGHEMTMSRFQ